MEKNSKLIYETPMTEAFTVIVGSAILNASDRSFNLSDYDEQDA